MKNSFPAPIALFVYNRLDHLKKSIKSLKKNKLSKKSDLIVFSDGYKNNIQNKIEVEKIRGYLGNLTGFNSIKIHEREKNPYGKLSKKKKSYINTWLLLSN